MNLRAMSVILAAGVSAHAQGPSIVPPDEASRHEFGIQAPVWFRAKASFSGTLENDAGPITGSADVDARVDRFYDDGFMGVNSAGNPVFAVGPGESFHRSTYFGFESNSQVTTPRFGGGGTTFGHLSLHNVALAGGEYTDPFSNDESPSVELFYRYGLREEESWALDLELGLSWMHLEWDQSSQMGAVAGVYEDRFNTGTVDPTVNVAAGGTLPYAGPFTPLPGSPWIGSNPMRQPYYTRAAVVSSRRDVTYDSIMVRIGPGLDWKPLNRLRLGVLAGVTAGWASTDFSYRDTIMVADPAIPVIRQEGKGSSDEFFLGLYSAVRGTVRITERWDVLLEARHMWVNDLRSSGDGRSVRVDLAEGMAVSAGVSCRF